jgi:hypothetical protein
MTIPQNSARLHLALAIAVVGLACSICAQTAERRLEQYGCAMRLPGLDFKWLTQAELPGATLACRDSEDRFVILIVAQAPPGYRIDARQGAAFEKGMARNPGIERLSGTLTHFLGMPCYEMRGRIQASQSLTLTRCFATNGFLYNLQAMIPETPDGGPGKFDDLLAAFQFMGPAEVAETGGISGNSLSNHAAELSTANAFAPAPTGDFEHEAPAPRESAPPMTAESESTRMPWVSILTAGGILGVGFTVFMLRRLRNDRRVL